MYIIAKRRGIVSKLLCLIKDTNKQEVFSRGLFFFQQNPEQTRTKTEKLFKTTEFANRPTTLNIRDPNPIKSPILKPPKSFKTTVPFLKPPAKGNHRS